MKPLRLLPAALALLLFALCLPQLGFGRRLSANTIDPVATLSNHGNRILVTGPIRTTQIEWVELRVTITQRTTGAVAEGWARFIGTSTEQHWQVSAFVIGDADFESGAATATAIAVTFRQGQNTDAHQWLVPVTITNE